jgi:hypothetical protein
MAFRTTFMVAVLAGVTAVAADMEPALGKKGKLLLEESFSSAAAAKDWTHAVGKVAVVDGALSVAEQQADKHVCAVRRKVAVQDAAVQFEFTFDGAKLLHFGYDPAPGELKKKGHLFSVVVTPESWSIIEHNDKADPQSKQKVHVRQATKFEQVRTYVMLVECRGPNVAASVAGKEPLKATASDFAVKKPALVFRVGNDDGKSVRIDNVKVWELE